MPTPVSDNYASAQAAIDTAIKALAEEVVESREVPSAVKDYADAIKQLAEGRAWMRSVDQPH